MTACFNILFVDDIKFDEWGCESSSNSVLTLLSLCRSGPRPELHAVAAHGRAEPAQTQSTAPGPAALR